MDVEVQGVESPLVAAPENTQGEKSFGDVMAAEGLTDAPADRSSDVIAPVAPHEDNRDFRGMAKAKEAEAKEFKQLYREAQAKLQEVEARQTPQWSEPAAPPTGTPDEQALQLLGKVVEDKVNQAVAPLRQAAEAREEDRILTDFQADPRTKRLAPEIATELQQLPQWAKGAPLQDRLMLARAMAYERHSPVIEQVNQEIGMEKAYQNQDLKRSQVGSGPRPSQAATPSDDLLGRIMSGRVPDKEWRERKTEIDQLIKEQTFGST